MRDELEKRTQETAEAEIGVAGGVREARLDRENRSLTRAERAILAVLLDPQYYKATNAEKAKAAGVAESTFYEIMRDPWFREQQKQAFYDMIAANLGPIVAQAVKTASENEGRDGHQDRKMLLEMAGLYVQRQKTELTGEGGGPVQVSMRVADLSDEELQALLEGDEHA